MSDRSPGKITEDEKSTFVFLIKRIFMSAFNVFSTFFEN